jgi:hypothetical protein
MDESGFVVNWSTEFTGVKVYDNNLLPTRWHLSCDIMPAFDITDNEYQNTLNRMRWWTSNVLNDSVYVSIHNEWAIQYVLGQVSNNIVLLPAEPGDDTLCICLHAKLQAICEGRINIGIMEIGNDNVDMMRHTYSGDMEDVLPTIENWMPQPYWFSAPWWHRVDGTTVDIPQKPGEEKTIPQWHFELTSIDNMSLNTTGEKGQVLYPQFRPTVIKGGKSD